MDKFNKFDRQNAFFFESEDFLPYFENYSDNSNSTTTFY